MRPTDKNKSLGARGQTGVIPSQRSTAPTVSGASGSTPGPWTCDVVVDDVYARPDHTIQPTYALNVQGNAWPILSSSEARANARLIAAAPDLLAAARLAALNFNRSLNSGNYLDDDDHEAWTALNHAIGKALGAA